VRQAGCIFGTIIAVLLAANLVGGVLSRVAGGEVSGQGLLTTLVGAILLVAALYVVVFSLRRKRWLARLATRVLMISSFVSLLVAFPLWLIAWQGELDTTIRQALIAATIIAAGWLVTFLIQEYRRESEDAERRDDVRRAIRTEIELHYIDVHDTDWKALRQRLEQEFFKDARYVPFAPRRNRDRFLAAALDRVELLSEDQIVHVMRYYELAERLELMNEDIRSQTFKNLQTSRRKSFATRFLTLEETCMTYALKAIKSLSHPTYYEALKAKYPPLTSSRKGPATSCQEGEE